MDPITIGALAVAAGTAAYKAYKSFTAESPKPRGGGTTSLSQLRALRGEQDTPEAPPVATGTVYQPTPSAVPTPTQPGPVRESPAMQAITQPTEPLARLRAIRGGYQ